MWPFNGTRSLIYGKGPGNTTVPLSVDASGNLNIVGGGGGGGGGAVTVADGADAAQGAIADPLVAAGAQGTASSKLRRLTADLDAANSKLTSIDGHVDGVETLVGTTNTTLATIDTHVDGLETLVGITNSSLATLDSHVDGLETLLGTNNAVQGAIADVKYSDGTGAADGTIIALLKGMYTKLHGAFDTTNTRFRVFNAVSVAATTTVESTANGVLLASAVNTRLVMVTFRETSGSAPASFSLKHGTDGTGDKFLHRTMLANESETIVFGDAGLAVGAGVYLTVITGAVAVSVAYKVVSS